MKYYYGQVCFGLAHFPKNLPIFQPIFQNEDFIAMTEEFESEVRDMCNLSRALVDQGIEQGMKQGVEKEKMRKYRWLEAVFSHLFVIGGNELKVCVCMIK